LRRSHQQGANHFATKESACFSNSAKVSQGDLEREQASDGADMLFGAQAFQFS
jgi:hypothetical protein